MGRMNIYVGNLSFEVTDEELGLEFMAFGQVTSVTIFSDRYIGSGQPKGYGYVEMVSKSEGDAAIASLNGKSMKGRMIEVIGALPLSDRKDIGSLNEKRVSRFNVRTRQREQ